MGNYVNALPGAQRKTAAAGLKQIHGLIEKEQYEQRQLKRLSGSLGGLLFSPIFCWLFLLMAIEGTAHFSMLLVAASFAFLPLGFSAYFVFNYRWPFWKFLGAGAIAAVSLSALFAA